MDDKIAHLPLLSKICFSHLINYFDQIIGDLLPIEDSITESLEDDWIQVIHQFYFILTQFKKLSELFKLTELEFITMICLGHDPDISLFDKLQGIELSLRR